MNFSFSLLFFFIQYKFRYIFNGTFMCVYGYCYDKFNNEGGSMWVRNEYRIITIEIVLPLKDNYGQWTTQILYFMRIIFIYLYIHVSSLSLFSLCSLIKSFTLCRGESWASNKKIYPTSSPTINKWKAFSSQFFFCSRHKYSI